MKLLLVITGLAMGGAERVAVNLAEELVKRQFQVKIVYLTGPALVLPKSPYIEIQSLDMSSKLDVFSAYRKLSKIIKVYSPDIVHSHMFHANLLARLVRLRTKFPRLICTAHSTKEGGWLTMLAYRLTDQLATISTNVSQEAVEIFTRKKAAPPGRMIAVPNGIDTEKFKNASKQVLSTTQETTIENPFQFIAIGRLVDAKDYPNLLKAFNIVRDSYQDNVRLLIVGDGPLRNHLTAQVDALHIANSVTFLGMRNDVPELLSMANAFVLSSKYEGLPLVLAEAMACEKPVIATDCGGVKEVIGDAGILVQPQSAQALADGMLEVLRMPQARRVALGKAARKRIQDNFSLEANIDRYIDIYKFSNHLNNEENRTT